MNLGVLGSNAETFPNFYFNPISAVSCNINSSRPLEMGQIDMP